MTVTPCALVHVRFKGVPLHRARLWSVQTVTSVKGSKVGKTLGLRRGTSFWNIYTIDTLLKVCCETGEICGLLGVSTLWDTDGSYTLFEVGLTTGLVRGLLCVSALRHVDRLYTPREVRLKCGFSSSFMGVISVCKIYTPYAPLDSIKVGKICSL